MAIEEIRQPRPPGLLARIFSRKDLQEGTDQYLNLPYADLRNLASMLFLPNLTTAIADMQVDDIRRLGSETVHGEPDREYLNDEHGLVRIYTDFVSTFTQLPLGIFNSLRHFFNKRKDTHLHGEGFTKKRNQELAEHASSFLFALQNMSLKPFFEEETSASGLMAKLNRVASALVSPVGLLSSAVGLCASMISHAASFIALRTADSESIHEAARFFTRFSDLITPFAVNIAQFKKASLAIQNTLGSGAKFSDSLKKYDSAISDIFQGTFAAATAPLYLGGLVNQIINHFKQKKDFIDDNGELKQKLAVAEHIGNLLQPALEYLQTKTGMFGDINSRQVKQSIDKYLHDGIYRTNDKLKGAFYNLCNSPYLKGILTNIMPTDFEGNILTSSSMLLKKQEELGGVDLINDPANLAFGFLPKHDILNTMFDLLHPIQSFSMPFVNSAAVVKDPDIQSNGNGLFRFIDSSLGVANLLFSIPHIVISALKYNAPLLMVNYYHLKQRYLNAKHKNEAHNVMDNIPKTIGWMMRSQIPLLSFAGQSLYEYLLEDPANYNIFLDETKIQKLKKDISERIFEQETKLKTPAMFEGVRGAMRTLLNNNIGRVYRDEYGLTAADHSKRKFYEGLETTRQGIKGIPFFGWIGALIISMMQRFVGVKGPAILPKHNPSTVVPAANLPQAINPANDHGTAAAAHAA
jgi:hypothetical protein